MKRLGVILALYFCLGKLSAISPTSDSVGLSKLGGSDTTTATTATPPASLTIKGKGILQPYGLKDVAHSKNSTKTPWVGDVLKSVPPAPEFGKLMRLPGGKSQLWDGKRLVFEAKMIRRPTVSDNGIVALEAVVTDRPPAEDVEGNHGPTEVWIVYAAGRKVRISPPEMIAYAPVISRNGKYLAFTANLIDARGVCSPARLYVGDFERREYTWFSAEEPGMDDYFLACANWVKNDSALVVIQDHGETGGHFRFWQIDGEFLRRKFVERRRR